MESRNMHPIKHRYKKRARTWEELEVHVFPTDALKFVRSVGLVHQQEWNLLEES
jgi:hypothetical protein